MILVPMTVEALIVNRFGNSREYADIAVNYELLNGVSLLGGVIEPQPFKKRAAPGAGVHLHFILPDGLTQGMETENGFDYPAVPDRYLVTRLTIVKSTPDKPVITHKSWILESSYVGRDNVGSISIPEFSDKENLCRYLGRTYPYENTAPPGEYLSKLTVLGAGTPYFAACYQTCRSVFGFHDDLKDVKEGELIYTVAGWYAERKNSPLYGLTGTEYEEKLREMGFFLGGGWREENDSDLLLHGAVFHVKWEGEDADYPTGGPEGAVRVALGYSSAEALSALAAKEISRQNGRDMYELERILNILQSDLLGELGEIDGILKTEDRLHRGRFGESGKSGEWLLRPADGNKNSPEESVRAAVSALNKLQKEAESLSDIVESKKTELYDVWYTYMLLYSYPPPPFIKQPLSQEELLEEGKRILGEIETYRQEWLGKEAKRQRQQENLKSLLADQSFTPEFKMAQEQFFFPEVPVILAAGEGVSRTKLFGTDGRFREDGLLSVRREREVITSVSFMEGGGKISWDSKTIKPFCDEFTQRADVPQAAYQLYDETAFLYLAEGGSGKEYTGTLPSAVSVTCFHPPWNPLFLDWRLHFLPSRTQADPDNTMEDWRLGDIDYSYKGAGEAGELKQYRGRMIITPHAAQGLSDAITRHIETFRYNETLYRQLSAIAGKAKELPVLSQNMSGLNEAFLCKDQAVSFPIFGVTKTAVSFADAVRAQVGDYGELSLNVNMEFLPVRAGFIRPDALRMIDTFGQTAELDSYLNDIAVAESIRPEGGGEYGVLPPRLSGPGSLCLDWEEKAPEFSPVCGYLMPDFLNSRISIYDEAGGYEGNLHLVWLPDGSTRAGFTALEDGKKRTLSGHMRHFIHGMTESGDGVFRAFLKLIDERLSERISAGGDEDQELSMLTGRPLAMLRGGLSLKWQGLLPYSKALKDFGKRNTYGFEENTYGARIGDVRYASDGLIGYYRGEETGSTYRTFYPAYGAKTMKDPYFSCNSDLELKVQHEKVRLTFLLDVTGSIHIRTGILPVYEKKPDPVFFRDALEYINLRLPIYPILTGPERAGIPQIGGKEPFFWYCRKNGALERREIGEPPVAAEMHQEKNSLEDGFMSRE